MLVWVKSDSYNDVTAYVIAKHRPLLDMSDSILLSAAGDGKESVASVTPLGHHSPHAHQPRSSLNPTLLGFYGGFITQTRLIKSLDTGD